MMMSMNSEVKIIPIRAFTDNYIWCVSDAQNALVVDPGDAQAVHEYLAREALQLSVILITHHHADHTGGVSELQRCFPQAVTFTPHHGHYAFPSRPAENTLVALKDLQFSVLNVPGHTLDHIAFYEAKRGWLFCGDTLFGAGCGRIFEGTAAMLWASLQTLASLPRDTQIYCAHEYTLNNLKFATMLEPNNHAISKRIATTEACLRDGRPSLPSTLAEELASNPFLRLESAEIQSYLHQHLGSHSNDDALQRFTILRTLKDHF
ncbi:MAG: hydroxyacylglutathione hydrolase [Methylophilaceae bacterium]|nr:hydroxyacylglutathione hydrolase [Methylophilaceae bacterium]